MDTIRQLLEDPVLKCVSTWMYDSYAVAFGATKRCCPRREALFLRGTFCCGNPCLGRRCGRYPFVIGATLVVLFLLVLVRDESRAMRLWSIPGPRRWPIMGNIPDLTSEPWLRFYRFYQKYGSIYKMFVCAERLRSVTIACSG